MADRPYVPLFGIFFDFPRSLVNVVDCFLLLHHQGRHVVEELYEF